MHPLQHMLLPAFNLQGAIPFPGKNNANEGRNKPQGFVMPSAACFRRFTAKIPPRPGDSGRNHVFEHKVRKKNAIPTVAVY